MTMTEQIVFRNDYEWEALELLKGMGYAHAKRFETRFLMKMGPKKDMNRAFTATGWDDYTDVTEPGSHHLTMEFLISLNVEETDSETKIYFCFFNEFEMTLKQFSSTLGFHQRCILDPNTLVAKNHYERYCWWSSISDSIVSFHNPTLRFLAKWLAMVMHHPRSDLHLCSLPKLQCLYAMANKICFSPIRSMIAHW